MKRILKEKTKELIIGEMEQLETMRRKRGIKVSTLCSETGVSSRTYARLKKGSAIIWDYSSC